MKEKRALNVIICQQEIPVISRNYRVGEIHDEIQQYNDYFNYLQSYDCYGQPLEDCQNLEVWRNLRSKHSKNITNLQEKLASYNRTIQDILIANKQQISSKNESMMKLFPEFIKMKNDEEQINLLLMVVNETYVKSDISEMYATIFASMQLMQSGNESNETDPEDDFPLIDEEYFEGINETNYTYNQEEPEEPEMPQEPEAPEGYTPLESTKSEQDDELFSDEKNKNQPEEEPKLVADDIPEGKNVQEHDNNHIQELNQPVDDDYNKKKPLPQNLNIMELRKQLKADVKDQGRYVLHMLQYFKNQLMQEQSRLRQEICNFEREIINIHKKHLQQIITIFAESRKIQKQIFEKDDAVLQLDMKVKFCEGAQIDQKNFDDCQAINNKKITQIDNIHELIQGTVKELDKLMQYEDKNIYDPNFSRNPSQVSTITYRNSMEYTDYNSNDQGKLISRKIECVITECREKRVTSEQNFQLLLKKKYSEMSEEDLLKDGDENSSNWLENVISFIFSLFFTKKTEDLHQRFNLMDENFGSMNNNQEQEQQSNKITEEQIESSMQVMKGEIQDDSDELMQSIKAKLSDNDSSQQDQIQANNLIMHENTKNAKKKINKKNQTSKKTTNKKKEKNPQKKEEIKEGLFSRFYHYFFGNDKQNQSQNFL